MTIPNHFVVLIEGIFPENLPSLEITNVALISTEQRLAHSKILISVSLKTH